MDYHVPTIKELQVSLKRCDTIITVLNKMIHKYKFIIQSNQYIIENTKNNHDKKTLNLYNDALNQQLAQLQYWLDDIISTKNSIKKHI